MKRLTAYLPAVLAALAVVLFAALSLHPASVHAQASGLKVAIFRPGEGETLYSNSSTPFAAVPVTGRVSADEFDVRHLQVRLEVFQGTELSGSATLTPQTDGTFVVDVGINPHAVSDLAELEHGCDSRCHSMQRVILPAGQVRLRVTASDPLGRKAVAERSVIVEYAGYADVPVQVVVDGEPGHSLAGIKVVAKTRLYLWRAREFSAVTDSTGRASIYLERLTEAPTNYVIQIEPRIMDGSQIAGGTPVSVIVPPGATSIAMVTLAARVQRGEISGIVGSARATEFSGLRVRAIELSTGRSHTAELAQSRFRFSNLSLNSYLLTLDDTQAAALDIRTEPQTIDLRSSPLATVTLQVLPISAHTIQGKVHDSNGAPLPFAWVAANNQGKIARAGPTSGEFTLRSVPGERVVWATAPGYWSRPVASAGRTDIALKMRPDTRHIPWGSGSIVLPSQTIAEVSGNQISVKRGWVWGKGTGGFNVRTSDLDVALQSGSFALEFLPGETNWLYIREGQAQVTVTDNLATLTLGAGQMLASGKGTTYPAVLDDAVIRILHLGEKSQVPIETDPAIMARLRDGIERLGILSFRATMLAFGAVIVAGVTTLLLRRRRRRIAQPDNRAGR